MEMRVQGLGQADAQSTIWVTGEQASGQFRCSTCSYGVTVYVQLPRCPMCAGEQWLEAGPAALLRMSVGDLRDRRPL
jgi:hypothetical protein